MDVQRELLLLVILTAAAGAPAVGQTATSIPDFSGLWSHEALNGLELPLSGPGPVRNRSRVRTGPQDGVGNGAQLVGDYSNPILQPWAAQVVKKFGEISLAGKGYPTPRNQCWPEQVPFVCELWNAAAPAAGHGHHPLPVRSSVPPGAPEPASSRPRDAILVRGFGGAL